MTDQLHAPPPEVPRPAHPVAARTTPMMPAAPFAIRPVRGLATASLVLGGLLAAVLVGQAITAFQAQQALLDYIDGGPQVGWLPYDTLGVLLLAVAVPAWVVTSLWTSRVRSNAEQLTTLRHRRGAVWCWLGWFVPVVALWFPRQVVEDNYRASDREHPLPPHVNAWWGCWLLGTFIGNISDRVALSPSGEFVSWLGPLNAVGAALVCVAFVLWARIVAATVRLQEAAAARG